MAAKSTTFQLPLRACQNLTNSTDAKTKMLMEEIVNLHLPRLQLRLPPSLPTCAVSLARWLAGYSENIEWKAFSTQPVSQSVSHLGRGDLDGESSLASGFDPRVLWQSLGLRNLESLFHSPASPSTRAFMASPLPLHSIYLISNIFCIHIYMCLPAQIHPWAFPWVHSGRKQQKSNLSWNPVPTLSFCTALLDTDVWWKELLHLSSIRECTPCNIPGGLFCCLCVRVCSCTRIRSGLPGLGRRRWASLWMCSGSPAPVSRNPSLCLATGAGSLWMQTAACNSGGGGWKTEEENDRFEKLSLSIPHAYYIVFIINQEPF